MNDGGGLRTGADDFRCFDHATRRSASAATQIDAIDPRSGSRKRITGLAGASSPGDLTKVL
ncbi:MAG: hypothetical protein QNJ73_08250 [Gammaproteobacteria bacterium]|nr:hypothetical protein [Gammaproteobacteria bacterium]